MEIGNIAPQTTYKFLAGLTSEEQSHRQTYYLATQRTFFNQQQASQRLFSTDVRAAGNKVLDSARALSLDGNSSVFRARAVSADGAILSGQAAAGVHQARYDITVQRLAGARGVVSDKLDAGAQNASGAGVYSFLVKLNSQDFRVNVRINQRDTNEQMAQKTADAINAAGLGLNATLERNNQAGTVQLRVDGFQPGAISSITLRDESHALLKDLGLSTKRSAEGTSGGVTGVNDYAQFTINNATYISESNRVALYDGSLTYPMRSATGSLPSELGSTERGGGGLFGAHRATFTLQGAGAATASVEQDDAAVSGGIADFVDATGDYLNLLDAHTAFTYRQTRGFIRSEFDAGARSLSDLGIEKSNGTYSIKDNGKLNRGIAQAVSNVQNLFGAPGGLAPRTMFGVHQSNTAPIVNLAPVERLSTNTLPGVTGFLFNRDF